MGRESERERAGVGRRTGRRSLIYRPISIDEGPANAAVIGNYREVIYLRESARESGMNQLESRNLLPITEGEKDEAPFLHILLRACVKPSWINGRKRNDRDSLFISLSVQTVLECLW